MPTCRLRENSVLIVLAGFTHHHPQLLQISGGTVFPDGRSEGGANPPPPHPQLLQIRGDYSLIPNSPEHVLIVRMRMRMRVFMRMRIRMRMRVRVSMRMCMLSSAYAYAHA